MRNLKDEGGFLQSPVLKDNMNNIFIIINTTSKLIKILLYNNIINNYKHLISDLNISNKMVIYLLLWSLEID